MQSYRLMHHSKPFIRFASPFITSETEFWNTVCFVSLMSSRSIVGERNFLIVRWIRSILLYETHYTKGGPFISDMRIYGTIIITTPFFWSVFSLAKLEAWCVRRNQLTRVAWIGQSQWTKCVEIGGVMRTRPSIFFPSSACVFLVLAAFCHCVQFAFHTIRYTSFAKSRSSFCGRIEEKK